MFSPKSALNTIRIIHLALMVGPTLFSFVVAFLVSTNSFSGSSIEVLNYLSPAYFLIALAMHGVLFKAILPKDLDQKSLQQKMVAFQTSHIIRLAFMEGAALFAAVVALINGNLLHLITVTLTLALMFTKFPSVFLIESEVGLTNEEKDKFNL